MHSTLRAAAGVLCLVLASCNAAELSKGRAEVATSSSAPSSQGYDPKDCRSLGFIVGRGGGAAGGGWVSNETLIEYAMNDLRNKAAELGANYIQHDSPQLGTSGDQNAVTTSTATVSGTAYHCEGRASGTPGADAAAKPAAPEHEPPEGAAGFTFGQTREDAEAACREKYEWTETAKDSFGCSGAPKEVGVEATTVVKFCDDALCKIDVVVAPPPAEAWIDTFAKLCDLLEKRYGAGESKKRIPPECSGDDLVACFKDGRTWVRYKWHFKDRSTVMLRMKNKPGPDLSIRLSYRRSAASEEPAL